MIKPEKIKIMKVEDLNKAKIPVVKINKKLEEFKGKILFPKKLELANEMLSKVKLPNKNPSADTRQTI